MEKTMNTIVKSIKPIYQKAKSELLIKLSDMSNQSDKLNYLTYVIELFKMPLNQLRKDFYITEIESRYYLKESDYISSRVGYKFYEYNCLSVNKAIENSEDMVSIIDFEKAKLIQADYYSMRANILSNLTYSLFTITGSFINILNKKIEEISSKNGIEKVKESGKQLTVNQIVLLLQEFGFFTHPDVEVTSKVKQAALISLITGLNEKNIKTYIQKLDNLPLTNGARYQKDNDLIFKILSDLK